jgi:uncharacterized membrane protein YkgB
MQRHIDWEKGLNQAGSAIARYGLVFIFVAFGLLKFTPQEAASIQPLVANSPVFVWLAWADPQTASKIIGVLELTCAVLIAMRRFAPRLSAAGSLATAVALATTLSFLFTTPKLDDSFQGFILKDVVLLGAAIWSAGEALTAARQRRDVRSARAAMAAAGA